MRLMPHAFRFAAARCGFVARLRSYAERQKYWFHDLKQNPLAQPLGGDLAIALLYLDANGLPAFGLARHQR